MGRSEDGPASGAVTKKLLLTGVTFAALIAGPAMAADLARPVYRRPAVVAAPVYTWTGFYVGGNVGYSWGNARTDLAESASTLTFPPGSLAPDAPDFPGFPASFGVADSNTARMKGVIGGGQIGYNYQFNQNWVLGFEADIQGSGEQGSSTFVNPFSTPACTEVNLPPPVVTCASTFGSFQGGSLQGTSVTAYEAKIAWFGTVRGRLGVLITDQVLLYGTGGLAYGRVKISGNTVVSSSLVDVINLMTAPFPPGGTAFSVSQTNLGFSVGGGIEGKFSYWLPAGWTWKLEYLYLDLGSLDTAASFVTGPPGGLFGQLGFGTPLTGTITTHTHFTDNIVRVGLNYKFGNYYAPVVTE